jgi:asparagine N-glycosylation enzyme membrane subunit Stt3
MVIYQGMGIAKEKAVEIATSMALLAAGALLIFAGASKVWPGNALVNVGLFVIGLVSLVGSGVLLKESESVSEAVYAIILTVIGIALILFGVEVAKERWKRFTAH